MMDGSMFPESWHPVAEHKARDFNGKAPHFTRTERPPKYYIIDFGNACVYDPQNPSPIEGRTTEDGDTAILGTQHSDDPRDPFPSDVYSLGNVIREDFLKVSVQFILDVWCILTKFNSAKLALVS